MTHGPIRDGVRRLFRLAVRRPEFARDDVDAELASYLESRIEHLVARGMKAADARAEALRRLGGSLTETRERLHHSVERRERQMAIREWISDLMDDIRYAIRGLGQRRGFTAIAVLTLAIGIGANTAIFSAVNALLLRPLPFREPNRLMKVSLTVPPRGEEPARLHMVWSWPKFETFRSAQTVFQEVGLYGDNKFSLTGGEPERIEGEFVSAHYLTVLGVAPAIGRGFLDAEDHRPDTRRVVILSDALWQRRYNADSAVLGRVIDIDRKPFEVVGVLPPGFNGLTGRADVLIPITTAGAGDIGPTQAWSHSFYQVARLKAGVSPEQAASAVTQLGAVVDAAWPGKFDNGARWGASAEPLDASRVLPVVRESVLVLFGAVGFVLLIACVNLANLLLGRANARRREIAIRLALGAGRGRLVRLLLAESVLLSLLGGVASVVVAWWAVHALSSVDPTSALRARMDSGMGVAGFSSIRLDGAALAFAFGLALAIGVLFGLVPALQATSPSLTGALKEGGTVLKRIGGFRAFTGRRLLVVTEVALAVVLLAGSGLMVRSLANLLAVDPGFDARNVLTARLNVAPGALQRDSLPGFYAQLLERVGAVPGVTGVSLGSCPPLNGGCNVTGIEFLDRPKVEIAQQPNVGVKWATPAWFTTMRIPLHRGRVFTDADRLGVPQVVVVNETAARTFWPREDPIGKRVGIGQGGFDNAEVVGVVGDVRNSIDAPAVPDVFIPYAQSPRSGMVVFLRTAGDPLAPASAVRRAIKALTPDAPVYDVQAMTARVATATAQARFSALLLALFAAVALALAAIGIYGVMSFTVAQRTREIGIRMALGADRARVHGIVVGEGIALAGAGAMLGLGGALAVTRVLASLLYEVRPSDPATYVVIVVVLGAAAGLASWLPARRAARVDPATALRAE